MGIHIIRYIPYHLLCKVCNKCNILKKYIGRFHIIMTFFKLSEVINMGGKRTCPGIRILTNELNTINCKFELDHTRSRFRIGVVEVSTSIWFLDTQVFNKKLNIGKWQNKISKNEESCGGNRVDGICSRSSCEEA